jgi:signal transduction histidine kinase
MTIQQFIDEFHRQYGIQVDFKWLYAGRRLPIEVETAIFRIVQNLTNVILHAQ